MSSILEALNEGIERNKINKSCLIYSKYFLTEITNELCNYFKGVYTIHNLDGDFDILVFFLSDDDSLMRLEGLLEVYSELPVMVYNLTGTSIFEGNIKKSKLILEIIGDGVIDFKETINENREWFN